VWELCIHWIVVGKAAGDVVIDCGYLDTAAFRSIITAVFKRVFALKDTYSSFVVFRILYKNGVSVA